MVCVEARRIELRGRSCRALVVGSKTKMNVGHELESLKLPLLGAGKRCNFRRTIGWGGARPRANDDAIAGARPQREKQRARGHAQALDGSLALWRYAQGSRDRIALTELGLAQRSRRGRFKEPSQGSCLIGRPVTETLWRPARRPISRGSRVGIRESSAGTRQRALAPGGLAATGRGQWLTARSALARAFPRLAGGRSRRVDGMRLRGGPHVGRPAPRAERAAPAPDREGRQGAWPGQGSPVAR